MKKLSKIVLALVAAVTLFGCKGQMSENTVKKDFDPINLERRQELAQLALLGDYKVSEEVAAESLLSFLVSKDSENERAALASDYNLIKIDTATVECHESAKSINRSSSIEEYEDVDFYLYQIGDALNENIGYAVLSNDRRIGEIITISDNSEFNDDITDSPFMQMFCTNLEEYIEETAEIWNSLTDNDLEQARSAGSDIVRSGNYTYSNWNYNSGNISSIIKTNWAQGYPYNAGIKAVKGNNYITGCGATAVAQVMAFHEYPKSCTTNIKNEIKNKWSNASSWNGEYDWSLIKADPSGANLSTKGKMMLGAFMYQVAEGVKSSYGTSLTSTKTSNYPPFLQSIGYKTDSVQSYSYNAIKSSIDNKCPVIITGACKKNTKNHKFLWWKWETVTSYEGGHAWVIDGYCNMKCTATNKTNKNDVQTFTADYVHCNLGWSGVSNGYYIENVFTVNKGIVASDSTVEKIARSSYGENDYYQYCLQIITNIKPNN